MNTGALSGSGPQDRVCARSFIHRLLLHLLPEEQAGHTRVLLQQEFGEVPVTDPEPQERDNRLRLPVSMMGKVPESVLGFFFGYPQYGK